MVPTVDDVEVQELGLQTHTDETGETIGYYAIAFSLVYGDQQYNLVKSLDPDTEPEDLEYTMAIETGKQSVLAKALQDDSNDPAEQATS